MGSISQLLLFGDDRPTKVAFQSNASVTSCVSFELELEIRLWVTLKLFLQLLRLSLPKGAPGVIPVGETNSPQSATITMNW